MKHTVRLARRAIDDRQRAHDWYSANYSVEFARRWFSGITHAIDSLSNAPLRCPKALENGRFPFDLFELLFGTRRNKHRILFTIENDDVIVLHIRHSAQQELTEEDLIT